MLIEEDPSFLRMTKKYGDYGKPLMLNGISSGGLPELWR
jgi:hypothetical protein